MAWVLCLPLSPGNCVTMAVTRGCWHLPSSDLDDIPTSQSFCEKSEGIIYANLLTHVKPSLNGCYYFFFICKTYILGKRQCGCISVKLSSKCLFGGLHQVFAVGFPALTAPSPILAAPQGLVPVPQPIAIGAVEMLARKLASPPAFSDDSFCSRQKYEN